MPRRMCLDTDPSHIRGSEMTTIVSNFKRVMTASGQPWTGGVIPLPILDTSRWSACSLHPG